MSLVLAAATFSGCSTIKGFGEPAGAKPDASGELVGPAPESAVLEVAFGLPTDDDGLTDFVNDVSTPGSANYGKFIGMEEVGKRFGASDDQVNALVGALSSNAIQGKVNQSKSLVYTKMTIAQASQFFGTGFDERKRDDGTIYVTPSQTAVPPRDVAQASTTFTGLTQVQSAAAPAPATGSLSCTQVKDLPPSQQPASRLDYYGVTALHNAGLKGQGMHMAMVEIESFSQAAMDAFTSCYGLPAQHPNIVSVTNDGLPSSGFESSLDAGVIVTVAPQLARLDVIQVDAYFDPVLSFAAALDPRLTGGSLPDVISTSIGYCEKSLDKDLMAIGEYQLKTAAAAGTTVVASSGDWGSSSCYPPDESVAVEYPSSSPYVTGVGGTQVIVNDGTITGEKVWKTSGSNAQAGGGGPSDLFDIPDFQKSAGIEGGKRTVPDVAYGASISGSPPYPVCSSSGSCSWQSVGGTSESAPFFAAQLVLLEQSLKQSGKPLLGWINPTLYSRMTGSAEIPGARHDVTEGDNMVHNQDCCTAVPGYDSASGWGSLNLGVFNQALIAAPPAGRSSASPTS